jgi:hypothetical protein
MSDKKVLTINPELFTFSNNKTKKTKSTEPTQDKIRIKNQVNRKHDTLRKQSLLKMIRRQQEERYKRLFENNNHNPGPSTNTPVDDSNTFNREFDEAREYLDKLTKKNELNVPKNSSFRAYPSTNISDSSISQRLNNTNTNTHNTHNTTVKLNPTYGCLKGGSLPTYRTYMNKLQIDRPKIHVGETVPLGSNVPGMQLHNEIPKQPSLIHDIQNKPATYSSIIENKIHDGMKRMNEITHHQDILRKMRSGGKPKKMKRKKTLRRTYKIGRSSVAPTVSVLVSNKTLRNRITTKGQLLKQTPIQDVRKYLIKQGIIRVGSTTPNDILRKMYESLALVCGEIKNHNPDTLLYNYINDTE